MIGTTKTLDSNTTYKSHTFEFIREGEYKYTGDKFYLVRDIKATKWKYQIIFLSFKNYFHSNGSVETLEEADEWWNRFCSMHATKTEATQTA